MTWLVQHLPALAGVLGGILSLVVAILHMLHKDDVAAKIEALEGVVKNLGGQNPQPPAA